MARKKKQLEDISQVHGRVEGASTLDQLMGDDGLAKYKTLSEEVYSRELDDMSKSEVQAHAIKMGLVPIDNRKLLQERLIREFKNHVNSYLPRADVKHEPLSQAAMRILAEGK